MNVSNRPLFSEIHPRNDDVFRVGRFGHFLRDAHQRKVSLQKVLLEVSRHRRGSQVKTPIYASKAHPRSGGGVMFEDRTPLCLLIWLQLSAGGPKKASPKAHTPHFKSSF